MGRDGQQQDKNETQERVRHGLPESSAVVRSVGGGYENFVSRIDVKEGTEKLSWLGKLDSGSLKQKVAASIVAISSIHLLRAFMSAQSIPDNKLMWYVIIHITFVLSALGMAYVDNMNKHE